jgi:subtilisin family serine protease
MRKRQTVACGLLALLLLLVAPFAPAQSKAKKKVNSQDDLPRFSYPVTGSASGLVQADDATFNLFASKVRADLDTVLRDYEINDKGTLRTLLSVELDLQELAGQFPAALETVEALRALEEKPASKLTSGLFARARLQAAIETKSTKGAAYDQAFAKNYGQAIDPLPWNLVQDAMNAAYGASRISTESRAIGRVKTDLDPAVQKSGVLANQEAWDLIYWRNTLRSAVPLEPVRAEVLKKYIAAHKVAKPDIWAAREVSLSAEQKLTPVLVAIWDSGIDVSLFSDQLYSDPHATASGTHGLAFDDQGGPSSSWLYPLTPEQQKAYPGFRDDIKGFLDLQEGIDSPEAETLQKKFKTQTPEQLHQFFELRNIFAHYIHGTHCAGIAVRGNPAARLVVARFNDQLPELPFAPTAEWAHRLGAAFQQMSEYFRTRNVRVVNMSWGDDPQEFETWISRTGGGADPVKRKQQAADLFSIWREAVETAIKNSPNTLFVTAAGNSDSDAGFVQDVPASLRLPNLIAVGAVNQAGDETSFTSYGASVVVHAGGYSVESFVPGGARLKLSGTSMASPNVVNLAAKLIAVNPALRPAQVIELIKQGATTSEDGRRHLIDEKRSMALLLAREKK